MGGLFSLSGLRALASEFEAAMPPSDHGVEPQGTDPVFFDVEVTLCLFAFYGALAAVVAGGYTLIAVLPVGQPLLSDPDPIRGLLLVLTGAAGSYACAAGLVARSKWVVTEDQFQWMLERHKALELPEPTRAMVRRDLAKYVEAMYRVDSALRKDG